MELIQTDVGAHKVSVGSGVYELASGKHFKIKVGSDTPLDMKCPAGKVLTVTVSVHGELVDA